MLKYKKAQKLLYLYMAVVISLLLVAAFNSPTQQTIVYSCLAVFICLYNLTLIDKLHNLMISRQVSEQRNNIIDVSEQRTSIIKPRPFPTEISVDADKLNNLFCMCDDLYTIPSIHTHTHTHTHQV